MILYISIHFTESVFGFLTNLIGAVFDTQYEISSKLDYSTNFGTPFESGERQDRTEVKTIIGRV